MKVDYTVGKSTRNDNFSSKADYMMNEFLVSRGDN